ncbi:predicted protein, partial [Arabidopsis lyrata subsp. lyrata]
TCKIVCAGLCFVACTAMELVRTKFISFIVAPKKRDYRELTDIMLVAIKQRSALLITASCAGEMRRRIKWPKLLLILLRYRTEKKRLKREVVAVRIYG